MTAGRLRRRRARPPLPGTWDGLVVICAGTFYNGHRLADQHIADELAGRGVPVLYVDPPVTAVGARRDDVRASAAEGPSLRLVGPHLARLTPTAPPGKTRGPMIRLTDALVARQIVAATSQMTHDVRAVFTVAGRPVLGLCGERHSVFWARDDFAAGARLMNLPAGRVRRAELRTARAADLVVAVSPTLEQRWRSAGLRVAMVPNGCDAGSGTTALTAPPASDVTLRRPVLGLVGTIGARVDLSLLEALADKGHSLLLVGQRQKSFSGERLEALIDRPEVEWVGHKPYHELASYLRVMDVGLVPYVDSEFNRASFPLKTLEYLAAGLPVVSTDLPATAWLATDLVRVGGTVEAFCDAVDAALREGSADELVRRRQALAREHDWTVRASALLELVP